MENKKFNAHVDKIFAQNGHETVKRRGKIAFADVVLGRLDQLNAITDEKVEPKCCWKSSEILNKMTVPSGDLFSRD